MWVRSERYLLKKNPILLFFGLLAVMDDIADAYDTVVIGTGASPAGITPAALNIHAWLHRRETRCRCRHSPRASPLCQSGNAPRCLLPKCCAVLGFAVRVVSGLVCFVVGLPPVLFPPLPESAAADRHSVPGCSRRLRTANFKARLDNDARPAPPPLVYAACLSP